MFGYTSVLVIMLTAFRNW